MPLLYTDPNSSLEEEKTTTTIQAYLYGCAKYVLEVFLVLILSSQAYGLLDLKQSINQSIHLKQCVCALT